MCTRRGRKLELGSNFIISNTSLSFFPFFLFFFLFFLFIIIIVVVVVAAVAVIIIYLLLLLLLLLLLFALPMYAARTPVLFIFIVISVMLFSPRFYQPVWHRNNPGLCCAAAEETCGYLLLR